MSEHHPDHPSRRHEVLNRLRLRGLADRLPRPAQPARDAEHDESANRMLDPTRDHLPEDPMVAMPVAVRTAAAWAWRLLAIVGATVVVGYILAKLSEIVIPVLVALLLTALMIELVEWLARWLPRGLATGIVLIGGVIVIAGAITLVVQQVSSNATTIVDQVSAGFSQIHQWLLHGPFKISDAQITSAYDKVWSSLSSGTDGIASGVLAVGTTVGHVGAGIALALFATFFFLYQGREIWAWFVRLFPRTARISVDSSGRKGWVSLTAYVRATILVAFTDAVGITIVALILRVPLAPAIGVIVFLGSFIPVVGALLSGVVAVLLALVAHGPVIALIMLGGVLGVQQIESHVLQPFLMGRLVRLHPLAILFSIATGAIFAGIVGALFAVPTAAFVNAVVHHLASGRAGDVDLPPTDPAVADPAVAPDDLAEPPATDGSVAESPSVSIDAGDPTDDPTDDQHGPAQA
ncbi:MAG TPA: AI-2E family transporter [Actinopolymorphaceae bacterium]|jgi:predicted PurR-regulated permease PerM